LTGQYNALFGFAVTWKVAAASNDRSGDLPFAEFGLYIAALLQVRQQA
jgi:hypothetical protein